LNRLFIANGWVRLLTAVNWPLAKSVTENKRIGFCVKKPPDINAEKIFIERASMTSLSASMLLLANCFMARDWEKTLENSEFFEVKEKIENESVTERTDVNILPENSLIEND